MNDEEVKELAGDVLVSLRAMTEYQRALFYSLLAVEFQSCGHRADADCLCDYDSVLEDW
jgi:hypothetical protein